MIFAAVDPGAVSGAIAVFNDGTPVWVEDLPVVGKMIDAVALARVLTSYNVDRVILENVHSMPQQGLSSTFRFGMGFGIIHGVCGALRLPMTLVAPTQWKGYFALPGLKQAGTPRAVKEASRAVAIRTWPNLHAALANKKDADRAEALLIGSWYFSVVLVEQSRHQQPEAAPS